MRIGHKKKETDLVKHLAHGVYSQHSILALDDDSRRNNPVTISHENIRMIMYHALDVLNEHFNLCVTVQPGIGKTRGCMMYEIQILLYQQSALLSVSYKAEQRWSIHGMDEKGL